MKLQLSHLNNQSQLQGLDIETLQTACPGRNLNSILSSFPFAFLSDQVRMTLYNLLTNFKQPKNVDLFIIQVSEFML